MRRTTNATPLVLVPDNNELGIYFFTITSGQVFYFTVKILGISSTGAKIAKYYREAIVKNVAGTSSLVGTVNTIGTDYEDDPLTDVSITVNDATDRVEITVTGLAAETWRWTAVVDGVEILYGT